MALYCKACNDPLVLHLESPEHEEGNEEVEMRTVPDDLELSCKCHFHWQCLLDRSSEVAISLKCPSCQQFLPTNQGGPSVTNPFLPTTPGSAILTRYVNEGGIEDDFDILPTITEEAYLEAHPEARVSRAMLVMCAEGDVEGIIELLQDAHQELGGDTIQLGHLIRYRDPLAGGKSGLHLAIERGQEQVTWLLLWLASKLDTEAFPTQARQEAESLHVQRLDASGDDIRTLLTDDGQSAEDVARAAPERWVALLTAGFLRP